MVYKYAQSSTQKQWMGMRQKVAYLGHEEEQRADMTQQATTGAFWFALHPLYIAILDHDALQGHHMWRGSQVVYTH